ncbi:MAG: ABC transporter permease [Bacteroidota bacterium]|nr:ABC transporter permease [Bacteroidota bacterium]MDP4234642.1 ABC transporter permease [Bacteroidota bacterium]MDP4243807.1 ABC transporter permease [Bacteroidota bacterium]MDP4288602.1 ABC transporter permease [Bacteroidota bacterium]
MTKVSPLVLFLRTARARAAPRIWGMKREPSWVFLEVMVPIISTTAFVYLYRSLHAPQAYVGFVILGAVISAYWLNVVWAMAMQLHWEKKEGMLQLYVLSPAPLMAVLVGMSYGGIIMASSRAIVTLAAGLLLFQVQLSTAELPMVFLIFAVTLVALYGLGMTLSSLFIHWGREAWHLALAFHEPAFFLTGMNFPLSKLFSSVPGIIAFVSALLPISFGLDAMRQLLLPSNIPGVFSPGTELLILVGLGVMFLVLAYVALQRLEYKARVEATLSLRWQ